MLEELILERCEKLSSSQAVVWHALGESATRLIGGASRVVEKDDLAALGSIDWRKFESDDWEGRALLAGQWWQIDGDRSVIPSLDIAGGVWTPLPRKSTGGNAEKTHPAKTISPDGITLS